MKRELQTGGNEPICWQGDIFNSAVSAGFADICLLQKRDGKAEREATLAFRFCLLGVKEIRGTDSAIWKIGIKSPFPFPKRPGSALHKTVEEGCPCQARDGAGEGGVRCTAAPQLWLRSSRRWDRSGWEASSRSAVRCRQLPSGWCSDVAAALRCDTQAALLTQ